MILDPGTPKSSRRGTGTAIAVGLAVAALVAMAEITHQQAKGRDLVAVAEAAFAGYLSLPKSGWLGSFAVMFYCIWFVWTVFPRRRVWNEPDECAPALSLALGAGPISMLVLISCVGHSRWRWLFQEVALFMIFAAFYRVWPVNHRKLLRMRRSKRRSAPPTDGWSGPLYFLVCVAVLLHFVSALAPPLLYDVTEYHLGAFPGYLTAVAEPRLSDLTYRPVAENFYARFPFPVESLYHASLLDQAGNWPGDRGPKLLNFLFIMCATGLLAGALRRAGVGRSWRRLAVLAWLAHPVTLQVGLDAFIDGPVALLVGSAAFLWLLAGGLVRGRPWVQDPSRYLVPAALATGTALTTKYTAAQLYLVPIAALIVPPAVLLAWHDRRPVRPRPPRHWYRVRGFGFRLFRRGEGRPSRAARLMGAAIALLVVPAVWLGKNIVFYGNPLEPFFTSVFRPGDIAAIDRERFYVACHAPQPPWAAAYWTSLPVRLGEFGWGLLGLLAVGAVGAVVARRANAAPAARMSTARSTAWRLAGFIGLSYLSWNLIGQSEDRFLLPSILILCGLSAAVAGRAARWAHPLPRPLHLRSSRVSPLPPVSASKTAVRVALCAMATVIVAGSVCQLGLHAVRLSNGGVFAYLTATDPSPAAIAAGAPTARETWLAKNLGAPGEFFNKAARAIPTTGTRTLMLYEARPYLLRTHRTAYATVWDENPLLTAAAEAGGADRPGQATPADGRGVAAVLAARGITHVLVNEEELRRFIEQYPLRDRFSALGIAAADARWAFFRTPTPEDLFPPFGRDPRWAKARAATLDFLREARARATLVTNIRPAPGPGTRPVEMWLADIRPLAAPPSAEPPPASGPAPLK